MTKMMETADKDIKTAVINMLHMFKKVEKNTSTMRRGIEDIKKTQKEFLEVKNNSI